MQEKLVIVNGISSPLTNTYSFLPSPHGYEVRKKSNLLTAHHGIYRRSTSLHGDAYCTNLQATYISFRYIQVIKFDVQLGLCKKKINIYTKYSLDKAN